MGYTRYWNRTERQITKEFVEECESIIKTAESDYGIKLSCYGDDDTKPIISEEKIMLNGDAKHNCESLLIINNSADFDFCKTNEHPYDIVVNAVLQLAEKHGLIKDVDNDGPNEEDKAEELLRKALS